MTSRLGSVLAGLWAAWVLIGILLAFLIVGPRPNRADPQPAALCQLDKDTVTADGTQLWPEGWAVPCKWLKKEQDV